MKDAACCPTPSEIGTADDEEIAQLAKALAHPIRVQIVRILSSSERCVCGDLVEQLPVAQSTVSQHLKILKEAGLVRCDAQGCYWIEPAGLRRLRVLVSGL
jgi:DNA-binding transcriptional ArsR family regulator